MSNRYVSSSIINRLPKYLRVLHSLAENGYQRTSSTHMSEIMDTSPSQVRQDFCAFGSFGATGYGYNVDTLTKNIENIIGLDKPHNIAVIGVGGIGRALLEHMDFPKYNYHVVAAFDINPKVIDHEINGVQVLHIDAFKDIIADERIDICMLTVPHNSAVDTAKLLCSYGVRAIWNFTGANLGLQKKSVIVQDVNFWDSLISLTYYLENK